MAASCSGSEQKLNMRSECPLSIVVRQECQGVNAVGVFGVWRHSGTGGGHIQLAMSQTGRALSLFNSGKNSNCAFIAGIEAGLSALRFGQVEKECIGAFPPRMDFPLEFRRIVEAYDGIKGFGSPPHVFRFDYDIAR